MALESTLLTALSGNAVRAFLAVQIALPAIANAVAYNINLLDGAGSVTFVADGVSTTFTGSDANFGTLKAVGTISEAVATEAPSASIALLAPTIGQISDPKYQGAPVRVWVGAVNEQTGAVVGSPEKIYAGWLDTATTTQGFNVQETTLAVGSAWERLFVASEGARLNSTWHRTNFPGEGGLDNAVEAKGNIMWGVDGASSATANYNGSVRTILNKLFPNLE
ncbi:MAG: hypothetical protein E6Q76_17460 [Rhizobium sp.]|nr:MAG: hypothetical protein E6Q76_17460 [Rhizobium sp.]